MKPTTRMASGTRLEPRAGESWATGPGPLLGPPRVALREGRNRHHLVSGAGRAPRTVEHDAEECLLVAAAEGHPVHALRSLDGPKELAAGGEDVRRSPGGHVETPVGVHRRAVAGFAAAQR